MDPAVTAAHAAVFSDDSPDTWLLVGAEKGKPVLRARGKGGLREAAAGFVDEEVQFAWVRLVKKDDGGDSARVKFVLLSWLGEKAPPLAKGRASEHKAALAALQGTHLTFQISDRAALATLEADVDDALTRAAGANYDLGNTRTGVKAGATASIKSASKQFFQQKDKETEIKAVQFEKHVRTGKGVSPCDLGNRVMTASATEAKRNTVGYTAAAPSAAAAPAAGDSPESGSARNRGIGARWPPEQPAGAPSGAAARPPSPGRLRGADAGAPLPPRDEQYDDEEGESDDFSMPGDSPPRELADT